MQATIQSNAWLGKLHACNHQQSRLQHEGGDWVTTAASDENMYQRELQDFAQAILQGRPSLICGGQGRAALQVSLVALESVRRRTPVNVTDVE